MTKRTPLSLTSPRLRGEVDPPKRSEGGPGDGDSPYVVFAETPPHPNPLPASGERERTDAAGEILESFAQ